MQNAIQQPILKLNALCRSFLHTFTLMLTSVFFLTFLQANAQDPADFPGSKLLGTKEYGFNIEPGIVTVPEDMRVRTLDNEGNAVVAKVHCKVGENFIVMLPDGQLVDRDSSAATVTDDKFVAIKARDLAEKLASGRLAGFKYKVSGRYVFVYNTTDSFFQVTERILNTMYKGVERYVEKQKIKVRNPDVPLVVIMFNKESQFQAYKPMERGVLAYYNMVSNHVILHEESAFASTRRDLAQAQLISTIAHEGAHQILHNIGVQQRLSLWPMWLSEGMAEYFAPTSFGRKLRWQGAGKLNNLRMFELEKYLQSRSFKKLDGETIRGAIEARKLDSRGYATAWSIIHFLADQHKNEFNELVKFYSGLPPMRGMASRAGQPVVENVHHFVDHFGDDFLELESEMVEHLMRQNDYESPVANMQHFAATAEIEVDGRQKRYAACFHDRNLAEQWLQDLGEALTPQQRQTAKTNVSTFRNRALAGRWISNWAD